MPRALARALVAEGIGTFRAGVCGCGAIVVDAKTGALGHVGVAISFGLVIMAPFLGAVIAAATYQLLRDEPVATVPGPARPAEELV